MADDPVRFTEEFSHREEVLEALGSLEVSSAPLPAAIQGSVLAGLEQASSASASAASTSTSTSASGSGGLAGGSGGLAGLSTVGAKVSAALGVAALVVFASAGYLSGRRGEDLPVSPPKKEGASAPGAGAVVNSGLEDPALEDPALEDPALEESKLESDDAKRPAAFPVELLEDEEAPRAGGNSVARSDRLKQELQVLRKARQQLASDPKESRRILDVYLRRFPNGQLKREHMNLRRRVDLRMKSQSREDEGPPEARRE